MGYNEQACNSKHTTLNWAIGLIVSGILLCTTIAGYAFNKASGLEVGQASQDEKIKMLSGDVGDIKTDIKSMKDSLNDLKSIKSTVEKIDKKLPDSRIGSDPKIGSTP